MFKPYVTDDTIATSVATCKLMLCIGKLRDDLFAVLIIYLDHSPVSKGGSQITQNTHRVPADVRCMVTVMYGYIERTGVYLKYI